MKAVAQRLAWAAILTVAVLAAFAPAVSFSYIGIDDAAYTFRNPFVAGGLTLGNAIEAATNFRHGGIWMPVTYASYMVDATVSRTCGIPFVPLMHFVNILLHAVNLLLLLRLTMELFGSSTAQDGTVRGGSALSMNGLLMAAAALVWAVHPLRVEPVAWIAARKELLWTLFALAGLLFWMRHTGRPQGVSRDGRSRVSLPWIGAFTCCCLASLCKPTAMCFPLLAALVEWYRNRDRAGRERLPMLVGCYLPLLAVAAVTAGVAAYSQTHVAGQDSSSLYAGTFAERIVGAASALGFYVRATLWPAGLHIDCRTVASSLPIGFAANIVALGCVVCAVAFLAFASRSARKGGSAADAQGGAFRPVLFSVAWFLVSVAPTLGVLGSFGVEAHADRFAYLPGMAFSFILAAFAAQWTGDAEDAKGVPSCRLRRSALAAFVALAVVLSSVTVRQLGFWRDDGTAYRRALDCDAGHPRAMVHVADALCSRRGDFDGGTALYRKALTLAGTVPSGGFNAIDVRARLAYALATRGGYGDFEEVKRLGADVLQDLRLDRRGMMLDALGTAYLHDGDRKRAALLFKASIDAPDRFWPKAATKRKLEQCR